MHELLLCLSLAVLSFDLFVGTLFCNCVSTIVGDVLFLLALLVHDFDFNSRFVFPFHQ